MAKENTKSQPTEKQSARLKVEFPRDTLQDAIRVPQAIEDANGGSPYPPTETAVALSLKPGSSEFRELLSSSFRYGLTKGSFASERISIEPLGAQIVQHQAEDEVRIASVKAALTPPLFASIYTQFRGKKLPEARFLQNTLVRDFSVPKEVAELCARNFITNVEFVGLVHSAIGGKWLSSNPVPTAITPTHITTDTEDVPEAKEDQHGNGGVLTSSGTTQQDLPPASPLPSTNQRVFITHGRNKEIVSQLKDLLAFGKFVPVVAEEHETPSKPVPDKVLDEMRSCFAGVIHVASENEFLDKEGNVHHKINDNVLIEIGAAMALYCGNYVLLVNKGVHLPSNLQGLYVCYYEGEKLDYEATMKLLRTFNEFK